MHLQCIIFLSHCIALYKVSHNNMLLFTVEHIHSNQEFVSLIKNMMYPAKSQIFILKSAILSYHREIVPLYPSIIFDVDIGFLLIKEASPCTAGCTMLQHPTPCMVHKDGMDKRISMLTFKQSVSNQRQLLNNHQKCSFTYSFLIFDVDGSSFFNKAFHCVVMTFAGCNMQGSLLIEVTRNIAVIAIQD